MESLGMLIDASLGITVDGDRHFKYNGMEATIAVNTIRKCVLNTLSDRRDSHGVWTISLKGFKTDFQTPSLISFELYIERTLRLQRGDGELGLNALGRFLKGEVGPEVPIDALLRSTGRFPMSGAIIISTLKNGMSLAPILSVVALHGKFLSEIPQEEIDELVGMVFNGKARESAGVLLEKALGEYMAYVTTNVLHGFAGSHTDTDDTTKKSKMSERDDNISGFYGDIFLKVEDESESQGTPGGNDGGRKTVAFKLCEGAQRLLTGSSIYSFVTPVGGSPGQTEPETPCLCLVDGADQIANDREQEELRNVRK